MDVDEGTFEEDQLRCDGEDEVWWLVIKVELENEEE